MNNTSLETDAAVLSLGHAICSQSSMVTCELEAENMKEICRASLPETGGMKGHSPAVDLPRLGVDLNNPFYPYKKLGQVRATEASECGSTTANKCINVGAPSGLLSGLNPGIIKHVRNSKQVNSIIEAMLQSEKLEKQELQQRPPEQSSGGNRGVNAGSSHHRSSPAADRLDLSLNKAFDPAFLGSTVQSSGSDMPDDKFNNDGSFDDDALTLKLSSGVISTQHASSAAIFDFSSSQDDASSSLSLKAAGVASQWLGLIQHDIKGRLAALRRSKKRVKNAIQTELPFLLTRDLAPHLENKPMLSHSSLVDCSRKETLDLHTARWKNLFGQMEKSLLEEGKHLERWLRQVEELQSQCEKGLKYVSANGLSNLDSMEDSSVWKNKESWERECTVRAAAASIYSTSNLIMTAR